MQSVDKSREILRQRAATLARPVVSGGEVAALDVVEFSLSGERYAVEVAYTGEVLVFSACTPLPCTPSFIVGIVSVRGRLRHVIDLRGFFELPPRGIVDLHQVILVRHGGIELGILVDLIVGIRRVPLAALQSALPTLNGIRAEYLKGVTADGLAVLDAAAILSDRRQIVQEEVKT